MSKAAVTASTKFNFDELKALTDGDIQRVNQVIIDNLASPVALINQLSRHIILSGGKRLRPMLVMLAAKSCLYVGDDDALLASVVEFIHTATLLHDDVVDDSDMRRGQKTASNIWGNEAAVLVGDYLYSRAFQMMVRAHSMRIMELLSNTTNTIAEGEVKQLLNVRDPDTSEIQYHDVIYGKTACLFEAATRIGAILAGADTRVENDLAHYGKHLGIAFQLIDDTLDYNADSEQIGKNVGDDLAEGKPTLPLIRALEVGSPSQQSLIREAITEGNADQFEQVKDIILSTGSLDYCFQQAREQARLAQESIEHLPDSPYRDALHFLADYAVERSH
ncbi:MAG: octaprenyl-diphosphate synthase [Gammaproteobacteria bacterium]|jgi:octaprenyl-diphosphate synthase